MIFAYAYPVKSAEVAGGNSPRDKLFQIQYSSGYALKLQDFSKKYASIEPLRESDQDLYAIRKQALCFEFLFEIHSEINKFRAIEASLDDEGEAKIWKDNIRNRFRFPLQRYYNAVYQETVSLQLYLHEANVNGWGKVANKLVAQRSPMSLAENGPNGYVVYKGRKMSIKEFDEVYQKEMEDRNKEQGLWEQRQSSIRLFLSPAPEPEPPKKTEPSKAKKSRLNGPQLPRNRIKILGDNKYTLNHDWYLQ